MLKDNMTKKMVKNIICNSANRAEEWVATETIFLWMLFYEIIRSITQSSFSLCGAAFHFTVADPLMGGVYMTLLNSMINLGKSWPETLSLKVVGIIDGEPLENNTYCQKYTNETFEPRGQHAKILICIQISVKNSNFGQRCNCRSEIQIKKNRTFCQNQNRVQYSTVRPGMLDPEFFNKFYMWIVGVRIFLVRFFNIATNKFRAVKFVRCAIPEYFKGQSSLSCNFSLSKSSYDHMYIKYVLPLEA